jgi:hypothetical protein
MIESIKPSELKNKKYQITMDNGKKYDFGLKNGQTYIDHHDKIKRQNYLKRHFLNPNETHLITNLIPSPALFSFVILWGPTTSIEKNIEHLNKQWKIKQNQRL